MLWRRRDEIKSEVQIEKWYQVDGLHLHAADAYTRREVMQSTIYTPIGSAMNL